MTAEPNRKETAMTPAELLNLATKLQEAANMIVATVPNEPDPEPAVPAWPTAPYVWWDGAVWTLDNEGAYQGPGDYWEEHHMRNGLSSDIRDGARRFAREAVPVTLVPTEAWEAWLKAVGTTLAEVEGIDGELIDAADSLAQEVAR